MNLIIFDMTGVCFTNEDEVFLPMFAKRHSIDPQELERIHDTLIPDSETGEISGHEVWDRIIEEFGIDDSPDNIIKELMSYKEEKPETISLIKSLEAKKAYLTNYNKEYWEEFKRRFDLSYFDDGIASYQIGVRKPDVRGFKMLMERFSVKPEETVFTDDKEKNLQEASKTGIHTIHFRGIGQFREELRKLNVRVKSE